MAAILSRPQCVNWEFAKTTTIAALCSARKLARNHPYLFLSYLIVAGPSWPPEFGWLRPTWCWEPRWRMRKVSSSLQVYFLIIPSLNEVEGGILVSPCPSARLSVCGQNRVRSLSSTILAGSISYLHTFRRCVACKVFFKCNRIDILANSLNL